MSLVEQPNLRFNDNYVVVGDSTGLRGNRYFFSDIDMLSAPSKDVVMPEPEVRFTLDTDTLSKNQTCRHLHLVTTPSPSLLTVAV